MDTGIKPHLKVTQHPNPLRRSFHVVREVSTARHMYSFGRESMFLSANDENPGDIAKMLAKHLARIAGVTDGHFTQYEVSIGIGEAFSWKDIGPLVLGEIIKAIYPEVIGHTLEVSTTISWSYFVQPRNRGFMDMMGGDDGHRTRYQDMADHEVVEVNFGAGRPVLDIEHLLGRDALQSAQMKAARETVHEE